MSIYDFEKRNFLALQNKEINNESVVHLLRLIIVRVARKLQKLELKGHKETEDNLKTLFKTIHTVKEVKRIFFLVRTS